MRTKALIPACLVVALMLGCSQNVFVYHTSLPEDVERYWIGPDLWANRLQDWRLKDGRIECIGGQQPLRTVHLLTRTLTETTGDVQMSVRTGLVSEGSDLSREAWSGFLIGAGALDLDYRARAIIHLGRGKNAGLAAGLDGQGHLVFYDLEKEDSFLKPDSRTGRTFVRKPGEDVKLQLFLRPDGDNYVMNLAAYDFTTGDLLQEAALGGINPGRLTGNVALISNGGADEGGSSFWFRDWEVSGAKLRIDEGQAFGPILSALHTLSRDVLKMTVQLPPVGEKDSQTVTLQTSEAGARNWRTVAQENLVVPGWTATFRIPNWDSTRDHQYRLVYPLKDSSGESKDYYFTGVIRREPIDKAEVVVAAFTGNSNTHGTFGQRFSFTSNRLWFPHADIVDHVRSTNPDLLVFTGDQVYEGRPTAPDRSGNFSSYLDYLYKWYLWCWAYADLARDLPSVCLPDDHDVYHGNIWGAGGRAARELPADGEYPDYYKGFEGHWRQDGGGYLMPAEFANMVQRTQTSHLPDPYDPTPVEQGITVYYTDMNYGGISFAILEDRKFKSSPSVMVPEGKVVNGFPQNPKFDTRRADVPGAILLGERQLEFLNRWVEDWESTWMKVSLSQTIFAAVSSYPGDFLTDAGTPQLKPAQPGVIPEGYRLSTDMDTNGWPQTGRNKALEALRRGFTFMIGGDQHLGSIVHHGVHDWDDAGYSLCVPSIANLWPRRWFPPKRGGEHQEGMPPYTGRYLDGFGNHITVWAVSNPVLSNQEPAELHDRVPGFGVARLNKEEQTITMECWPRYADPADPSAEQYPGWPLTISVEENYERKPTAYLPTLEFQGIEDPVIQLMEEKTGEIVYTIRAKGSSFQPGVFAPGTYEIRVGEPGTDLFKTVAGVKATAPENSEIIVVEF